MVTMGAVREFPTQVDSHPLKHEAIEKSTELVHEATPITHGNQHTAHDQSQPSSPGQLVRPSAQESFVLESYSDGDSVLYSDTEEALTEIEMQDIAPQPPAFSRKRVLSLEELATRHSFDSLIGTAISTVRRFNGDFMPPLSPDEQVPPTIFDDEDGERVPGDIGFAKETSFALVRAARADLDAFLISRQDKDVEDEEFPVEFGRTAPINIPGRANFYKFHPESPTPTAPVPVQHDNKPHEAPPAAPETAHEPASPSPRTFVQKLVTLFAGQRRPRPIRRVSSEPTLSPSPQANNEDTQQPKARRPFTAWAPGNLPPSKYIPGIRPMTLRVDHRVNTMAGVLLDRDGDVWEKFWQKYPDVKSLPWACTCEPWQRGKTCLGACGKSGGEGLDGDVVEEYPYQMGKIW